MRFECAALVLDTEHPACETRDNICGNRVEPKTAIIKRLMLGRWLVTGTTEISNT